MLLCESRQTGITRSLCKSGFFFSSFFLSWKRLVSVGQSEPGLMGNRLNEPTALTTQMWFALFFLNDQFDLDQRMKKTHLLLYCNVKLANKFASVFQKISATLAVTCRCDSRCRQRAPAAPVWAFSGSLPQSKDNAHFPDCQVYSVCRR